MYPGNSGMGCGGVAVFASTCLCCYSLWTGLKADLKQCNLISQCVHKALCCLQSAQSHPWEGQQGTALLCGSAPVQDLPACIQRAGRWKGLQENTWPSLNFFFFFQRLVMLARK